MNPADQQNNSFILPVETTNDFAHVATSPAATTPPPAGNTTPVSFVSGNPTDANSKKKKILAVLGVILMLVGVGAGVVLVRSQQQGQPLAWDCTLYTFSLDQNGRVAVANGSSRNEPLQQAMVYINSTLVETFEVPALAPGEGATLGTVSLPSGQSYTWKVEGSLDCENSGQNQINKITAQCSNVLAYDEDWVLLTASDLAKLKTGDKVRFTVSGTASEGQIDKARFTINGGAPEEVTDKKPNSNEFYYEYTIPGNLKSFSISAQVYHSEAGWF